MGAILVLYGLVTAFLWAALAHEVKPRRWWGVLVLGVLALTWPLMTAIKWTRVAAEAVDQWRWRAIKREWERH